MHKIKIAFLIATICFNASYAMENEATSLDLQITAFNDLLKRDMQETSFSIDKLTTEWTDSKICLTTALIGVGLCATSCVMKQESGPKMLGMGTTLLIGSGILAKTAMEKEKREREIYTNDHNQLSASIKELNQIMSQNTFASNTQSQQVTAVTTSISKQKCDANLQVITNCNANYGSALDNIKKLTAEYSPAKICFYITLMGIFCGSLAWLNHNNSSAQMAGIGLTLFLGSGSLGLISAINELQKLKSCVDTKANSRASIMEINRS